MRVAVIGAGISGNAAAWALATGSGHEVTVLEASASPGGHAATVEVSYEGVRIAVDTGFMVYNELTYPELTALLRHLGVETRPAPMSFSVSVDGGRYEWSGRASGRFGGFFAQRRNLVSASHLRMLRDILAFNRRAPADLAAGRLAGLSLGEYVAGLGLSDRFRDEYLLAMGAAIWSTSPARMLDFPAETFVAFCDNHRLLHLDRPVWRTVTGGSRRYVERLAACLPNGVETGRRVLGVRRTAGGVEVEVEGSGTRSFDAAILAVHADQALALLRDPSPEERSSLGGISYAPSTVHLHRDPALMPRRRAAWSAWNVAKPSGTTAACGCTYWMNAIQGIDPAMPLFVSLNPRRDPDPALTFATFAYRHPHYDGRALQAQRRVPRIQGLRRTWFAGAWTGSGFHEDGLVSGLDAAEALGARVPWRRAGQILQAAE